VGLNGRRLSAVEIFDQLNATGGRHGIGRADIVENRLVGMKSRGVYETPAGTIIRRAHQALESICLDKYTMRYKDFIAVKYAELVYNGLWFCQLREALDAFVRTTQRQRHRHRAPQAVQGQRDHGRPQEPAQPLPRRLRLVRRGGCL